ncbi:hypothetical protein [Phenylobacterium sp.]|uniref:hypothetical protein n=1 Tax=Phenylobacterium sp. TaxID=1871053 RepID=UPI0025F827E8|nr:hypothetical protein [Phenylobacterium sp.]
MSFRGARFGIAQLCGRLRAHRRGKMADFKDLDERAWAIRRLYAELEARLRP